MDRISTAQAATMPVEFKLNGKTVVGRSDEPLIETAKHYGIDIPHLCYKEGMRPDGNCRACVVEVKGERVLAPSCCRFPTAGMEVASDSARAVLSQTMVLELLLSGMPERTYKPGSELRFLADRMKVPQPGYEARVSPAADLSPPAMAVNLDACIQCTRCVRACREVQVNDVIGYAFRGSSSQIVFDLADPMGASTCVACGECVQACPTGALMPSTMVDENNVYEGKPDRAVDSVCPYCGVGCQLTYHIKDDKLAYVSGKNGPANQNRLCVKGRFGFDYISNPQRLTKPMIRKDGAGKAADDLGDPSNPWTHFRPATWEEALDRAAGGLKKIRDRDGSKALAGFGSAKCSNEE